MDLVLDYAFAHPDPAAIAAAGYVGVMRYLAPESAQTHGKILHADELAQLHAHGLAVGVVWETSADRAKAGVDAGTLDARRANAMADALGFPADRPIFYAVDFDANPSQVAPYFHGVVAAGGRPAGVYGGLVVVNALCPSVVPWAWQTVAWSHGQVAGAAHMYQRGKPTVAHPIASSDENVALQADWGGWRPDITYPSEETDMLTPEETAKLDAILLGVQGADHVLGDQSDAFIGRIADAVAARAPGGAIDVDKLADAIADKLAERLKS